ncbi:MAG: [acyl-carrier-protein] S-malonyltransferase [Flavobacteriales bacterium]|jgi:[acyl-carrier-protein] S-malonyltransferase|tara:strand:+ start:4767 stop:5642 length:876 start_codon:yes stop_codon:yes gene_type:complete
MKVFVFPGQGAQFTGMGKELYNSSSKAKALFEKANDILGFRISDIMFEGSAEELKETKVTQPAVFLHSVAVALTTEDFAPDMVAGHSLGELSALVAAKVISFEDGLNIVSKRAQAMQKACELKSGSMAAILALEDNVVETICKETPGIVVAANYNCPGQLVISGEANAVNVACEALKEAGAKRALILPVGGAFHSPLMDPAKEELAEVINSTEFKEPICPIYQNVNAQPVKNPEIIKQNLISQLTAPVRWTQIVKNMLSDGASVFTEMGPGKTLQGLVKKVDRQIETVGVQ